MTHKLKGERVEEYA